MKSILAVVMALTVSAEEGTSRRLLQFPAVTQPAVPAPVPVPVPAPANPSGVNPIVPPPTMPPLVPGGISIIPGLQQPSTQLVCNDYCIDSLNCPSTCALQTKTVYDPVENYRMMCGAPGACAGSQYTFDFGAGGVVEKIGFYFTASYAGYGTTINVVSRQLSKRVKVDKVLCSVPGACEGMRIITNGADVNDIECKAGACNGCVVMQAPEYKEKACYLY